MSCNHCLIWSLQRCWLAAHSVILNLLIIWLSLDCWRAVAQENEVEFCDAAVWLSWMPDTPVVLSCWKVKFSSTTCLTAAKIWWDYTPLIMVTDFHFMLVKEQLPFLTQLPTTFITDLTVDEWRQCAYKTDMGHIQSIVLRIKGGSAVNWW